MHRIETIECFAAPPRWLFVKITTSEGLAGWGEPVVEGRAQTVKACVEELSEYLIGKDPGCIEDIFQVLYRGGFYRGGPVLTSALSGIEQALWDIKGRRHGLPVYEFLGGACRQNTRVYNWIGGDRPEDVAAGALEQKLLGFTAIKMNATEEMHYIDDFSKVEAVVARVASIRQAVGREFGIAVDFHGRVHRAMAKVLARELDPYCLMFIEEPVLIENREALHEVARYTCAPIATGERCFTRWGFKELLQEGVVDIIQPDVSHAGGILELKKIAAMAESYDVALAPHCPLGPVALAACLQVDICCPNAFIQEQSLGIHYNKGNDLLDYVLNPDAFGYHNGCVANLAGPGLGVDVNEDKIRQAAQTPHHWKNPVWRNQDGTVAEW